MKRALLQLVESLPRPISDRHRRNAILIGLRSGPAEIHVRCLSAVYDPAAKRPAVQVTLPYTLSGKVHHSSSPPPTLGR